MPSLLHTRALHDYEIKPKCFSVLSICCIQSILLPFVFLTQSRAAFSEDMSAKKASLGICPCQKGLRDSTEAFEMHPVSAPSLSIHSEEAGNDCSFILVPEEPQNQT